MRESRLCAAPYQLDAHTSRRLNGESTMAAAASKGAEFYLKRGRLYADKGKLER